MSFGIANNVRSKEVRTCTPELFHRALESRVVAEMCAKIKGIDKKEFSLMLKIIKTEEKCL